jgi:hypothetical protein
MTYEKMKRIVRSQLKEVLKTRDEGQKEYAHDTDNVFANFERSSNLLDIPREKALMIFLLKHIDGISAYVKGHKSQRESVKGRITDAIVYLCLLRGMVEDETGKNK